VVKSWYVMIFIHVHLQRSSCNCLLTRNTEYHLLLVVLKDRKYRYDT
jgi:hypothetical protein